MALPTHDAPPPPRPRAGGLLVPHPGDEGVAGGEHNAAHVADHLAPHQPHPRLLALNTALTFTTAELSKIWRMNE